MKTADMERLSQLEMVRQLVELTAKVQALEAKVEAAGRNILNLEMKQWARRTPRELTRARKTPVTVPTTDLQDDDLCVHGAPPGAYCWQCGERVE